MTSKASTVSYIFIPITIIAANILFIKIFHLDKLSKPERGLDKGNLRFEPEVVVKRDCPSVDKHKEVAFSKDHEKKIVQIERGVASDICIKPQTYGIENVKRYRDLFDAEPRSVMFAEKAANGIRRPVDPSPGQLPGTVHVVWCGRKWFTFADYLSVMSAVRVLQPQKLIFHYNHLPTIDNYMYHMWFQELRQSLPYLELRHTKAYLDCDGISPLQYGLMQVKSRPDGGFYLGEKTLVTHIPSSWLDAGDTVPYFGDSGDNKMAKDHGLLMARHGGYTDREVNAGEVRKMKNGKQTFFCLNEDQYNHELKPGEVGDEAERADTIPPCLALTKPLQPRDIMNATTRLGALGRWLFYGREDRREGPKPGPDEEDEMIPLIGHMISIKKEPGQYVEWPFTAYLNVLSALHVAGLRHIYVHGNVKIRGKWWERLKNENISFVEMDRVETVFGQVVGSMPHNTDIMRAIILQKYGGIYMDWDLTFANPLPRRLRRYPAVFGYDWPHYGEWPESYNLGILMAKPNAPFLRKFIDSFRYYREDQWEFNAMLMPYSIWERHPELMHVAPHLQTICFMYYCHPAWHPDYRRNDRYRPVGGFHIREVIAFHFTYPETMGGMDRLENMSNMKMNDMFTKVGRKILALSGHHSYPEIKKIPYDGK